MGWPLTAEVKKGPQGYSAAGLVVSLRDSWASSFLLIIQNKISAGADTLLSGVFQPHRLSHT